MSGAKRSVLDRRDYSFHRTFPHFGTAMPAELPLMEYNLDAGRTMPDQNADGYPYGCTGYTQADCKNDQDKVIYDPIFIYHNTCEMEGHDPDQGCDIRTSCRSLRVYGALQKGETTDLEAFRHRSGQTFNVDKAPGRDWFDSFRIALRGQKMSISTGTIWFPEWNAVPQSGLLTLEFVYDGSASDYSWHNYKICGEKTIDGQPTLRVKAWRGANIGDSGWEYMDRETFNKAFDIYGTIGLITAVAGDADVRTIELDIYQTVLDYLRRILAIVQLQHLVNVHS